MRLSRETVSKALLKLKYIISTILLPSTKPVTLSQKETMLVKHDLLLTKGSFFLNTPIVPLRRASICWVFMLLPEESPWGSDWWKEQSTTEMTVGIIEWLPLRAFSTAIHNSQEPLSELKLSSAQLPISALNRPLPGSHFIFCTLMLQPYLLEMPKTLIHWQLQLSKDPGEETKGSRSCTAAIEVKNRATRDTFQPASINVFLTAAWVDILCYTQDCHCVGAFAPMLRTPLRPEGQCSTNSQQTTLVGLLGWWIDGKENTRLTLLKTPF